MSSIAFFNHTGPVRLGTIGRVTNDDAVRVNAARRAVNLDNRVAGWNLVDMSNHEIVLNVEAAATGQVRRFATTMQNFHCDRSKTLRANHVH